MAPSRDICFAVDAFTIANWNFHDLQPHSSGAKNQIEVAERIEVAEKRTVVGQLEIVQTANYLGATQRVLKALSKNEGKSHGKEFITK